MLLIREICSPVASVSSQTYHIHWALLINVFHPQAVDYGASAIVAKPGESTTQGDGTDVSVERSLRVTSKPSLATGISLGKRVPSFKVLNQSDARPSHFQELLKSNGRWRVVVFPGDVVNISRQAARLKVLGEKLAASDSFVRRFTKSGARYDSVFEVLLVHAGGRTETDIFNFPEVFRQYDELDGWDYWKIFVDDASYHEGHGKIYENFGVDPAEGCVFVLRPDQHVAYIGSLDAFEDLDTFFSGFMIAQTQRVAAS